MLRLPDRSRRALGCDAEVVEEVSGALCPCEVRDGDAERRRAHGIASSVIAQNGRQRRGETLDVVGRNDDGSVAELEFGVWNSAAPERNRIALLEFLSIFDTLPFSDLDASAYGPIRANLKKVGRIIGPIDMLLAAQAVANGIALVTNNTKEFKRVPNLPIEDWTK